MVVMLIAHTTIAKLNGDIFAASELLE